MNWILVVLQISAISPGSSLAPYYNWATLGEFTSEKACVAASAKLAQASQDVRGVKNFQCLKKD